MVRRGAWTIRYCGKEKEMSITPEFSRRLPLHRLGRDAYTETVEATPEECARIAKRLELPGIQSFSCRYRLTAADKGNILTEGWLSAALTQICVITNEPFDDVVAEDFVFRFVPLEQYLEDEALDIEAIDEQPYEGNDVDLGAYAVEQLALALTPFPRKPGAGLEQAVDEVPRDVGEEDDDGFKPFANLSHMMKRSD